MQDASHELRTPLTSLRTNIEVLAHGDAPAARTSASSCSRDVVAQLGEMTELIGELTELARGEEQAEPLEDVRLDLVDRGRDPAARRATIPRCRSRPSSRRRRWSGSRRASSARSRTCSTTPPSGAPPAAAVEVKLADGELTVRDHGPGIAEEDVPHVFERFYRATSARSMPGSGLGLAIVQQVAEAHGGTISRRGGARRRHAHAPAAPPRNGGRRDDGSERQGLLRPLLSASGFLRAPVFYLSYLRSELLRRKGRTILTVLGLAIGVALVIVISSLSRGLDHAQKTALDPLSSIGTDLTVTLAPQTAGHGGRRFRRRRRRRRLRRRRLRRRPAS